MSSTSRPFAIVTGSTKGLGNAIAKSLHQRGFDVAGIGRSAVEAKSTATFHQHKCDLSRPNQIEDLFHSKLAAQIRGRDRVVLVNNAGTLGPVGPTSLFGDNNNAGAGSISKIDEAIRLNLTSPMWLSGAVVRTADASAIVRIINVSSGAADNPYPGWATYCTSKAGLRMSGQVLAVDVGEFDDLIGRDIRIYDYAPGVVDTGMQLAVRTSDKSNFPRVDKFVGLHSGGKLIRAEDSARPVVNFALSGQGETYVQGRYGT